MGYTYAPSSWWEENSIILLPGKIGVELTSSGDIIGYKQGDGTTAFQNLPYMNYIQEVGGTLSDQSGQISSINGKITAINGNIQTLITTKLNATDADIKYATIDNLNVTDESVANLQVQNETITGTLNVLDTRTTSLETDNATINGTLTTLNETVSGKLSVADADIKYATIENLSVTNLSIDDLNVKFAAITVAVGDSWAVNKLAAGTITAGDGVIANGAIGNAQIADLAAGKLTAGIVNTALVNLQSADGRLLLDDSTLQISDANRVRVQIGKDASNDYNLYLWDAAGNLMWDAAGLKDSGIKAAIIRDDMVSDTANINGSKLDIESVVTAVNGATTLLQSSHIQYDPTGQTLDVAFSSLSTTVDGLTSTMASQGTSISAIQGQITNKVWQTDIDSAVDPLTGDISSLTTRMSSAEQKITDSAIVSTVTSSTSWTGLSNTASTASSTASSAASAAATAQTTANSKAKVFRSQPAPPYSLGDLWTSTTQETRVCTTARASGSYTASDWAAASSITETRLSSAESKITATAITNTVKANLGGADIASIINQTATDVTISTSHFKVAAASIDIDGLVTQLNTKALYAQRISNSTDSTVYGIIGDTDYSHKGFTLYDTSAGTHSIFAVLQNMVYLTSTANGDSLIAQNYTASSVEHWKVSAGLLSIDTTANTSAASSLATVYLQNSQTTSSTKYNFGMKITDTYSVLNYNVFSSAETGGGTLTDYQLGVNASGAYCNCNYSIAGNLSVSGTYTLGGHTYNTFQTGSSWPMPTGSVTGMDFTASDLGNLVANYKGGGGAYIQTWGASDARLKRDITLATVDCRAMLRGINVVQYAWISDGTHVDAGVTTQQLATICDRWVRPARIGADGTEYNGPDYDAMLPYIIGAAQQTADDVDTLRAQITALQGTITDLSGRLAALESKVA